jgi:hypothetical protein
MARISCRIFCTIAEVRAWLAELCEHGNLHAIVFDTLSEQGRLLLNGRPPVEDEFFGAFLYGHEATPSSLEWDAQRVKGVNCIQVRRGVPPTPCVLFMTEFALDSGTHKPSSAARALRALKRKLAKECKGGLVGASTTTGGNVVYRDIRYSDDALAMLNSGGMWKSSSSKFVHFGPR